MGGISDQISLKKTANWTPTFLGSHYLHRILNLSRDPAVKAGTCKHVSQFIQPWNQLLVLCFVLFWNAH